MSRFKVKKLHMVHFKAHVLGDTLFYHHQNSQEMHIHLYTSAPHFKNAGNGKRAPRKLRRVWGNRSVFQGAPPNAPTKYENDDELRDLWGILY